MEYFYVVPFILSFGNKSVKNKGANSRERRLDVLLKKMKKNNMKKKMIENKKKEKKKKKKKNDRIYTKKGMKEVKNGKKKCKKFN